MSKISFVGLSALSLRFMAAISHCGCGCGCGCGLFFGRSSGYGSHTFVRISTNWFLCRNCFKLEFVLSATKLWYIQNICIFCGAGRKKFEMLFVSKGQNKDEFVSSSRSCSVYCHFYFNIISNWFVNSEFL